MVRFQKLLQENKDNTFLAETGRLYANLNTAVSVLMLLIGICIACLMHAVMYSEQDLSEFYGFIFQSTNSRSGDLLSQNFSHFGSIMKHNLMVMGAIAFLCLLYRSYAALLTLGITATVWVMVMVSLTRRGMEESEFPSLREHSDLADCLI